MAYLVDAAVCSDPGGIAAEFPDLWRQVRPYNQPVQLALAAAERVTASARDPSRMALISIAPCRNGSPALSQWVESALEAETEGGPMARFNPILTLHAVDNLALSSYSIAHRNQAYCLGIGGAAGQAWTALEVVLDRLSWGGEDEALVMAGDQQDRNRPGAGLGVALLFSGQQRTYGTSEKTLRLAQVDHALLAEPANLASDADSARGLARLLDAVAKMPTGPCVYGVPADETDGLEQIKLLWEVS